MAAKKTNKRSTKTAHRSSSELAPARWLDALATNFERRAEIWIESSKQNPSPNSEIFWLGHYLLKEIALDCRAVARSASNALVNRGDHKTKPEN